MVYFVAMAEFVPSPPAGVLLCGGKSTRMGHDKATLTDAQGVPLWQRQLAKLHAAGLNEVWLALRQGQSLQGYHGPVIEDDPRAIGPMAGLLGTLQQLPQTHCFILAVDLPAMRADWLRGLWHKIKPGTGVIPVLNGHPEPVVAIYPQCLLPHIIEQAASGDYAMHRLIEKALSLGLLLPLTVSPEDAPCFANMNSPEAGQRHGYGLGTYG
jgi:molybdopterin-guanine dinucleotide biosynthesis protein A